MFDKKLQKIFETYTIVDIDITLETETSELGIDSLAFVSLVVDLEDYFEKELKDEQLDFTSYQKVADILAAFNH